MVKTTEQTLFEQVLKSTGHRSVNPYQENANRQSAGNQAGQWNVCVTNSTTPATYSNAAQVLHNSNNQ